MRKLIFLLLTMLILTLSMLPLAFAETATDSPPEPTMEFSWEYLATNTGVVAAVVLIAQYTKKGLDKLYKVPTRLYVYILAFGLSLLARHFLTGLTWADVPLLALNALLAAVAAMGTYDVTLSKLE